MSAGNIISTIDKSWVRTRQVSLDVVDEFLENDHALFVDLAVLPQNCVCQPEHYLNQDYHCQQLEHLLDERLWHHIALFKNSKSNFEIEQLLAYIVLHYA